jgi:NADH-quinone oxidoreductase subunit M
MIPALLIILPFAGGAVAWLAAGAGSRWARLVSGIALGVQLVLGALLWIVGGASSDGRWLASLSVPWIPSLGVSFSVAADGLSLVLVMLTSVIGLLSVLGSLDSVRTRVGFFHFCLMWSLGAVTGAFLAIDLFLFYVFWELMLIPLFLLILIWGHEGRVYAALKFFIFTQAAGLLLLVGIAALVSAGARISGQTDFGLAHLESLVLAPRTAFWVMLAFFTAFAVKLPAVPVHSWLADAHTEAPLAGSLVLAGVVLKVGGYGLIRFAVPLFPDAAVAVAPAARVMGVAGILYGALMAFGQTDLKRLVAYTSVSHMGFVLLGIFSLSEVGMQGAVVMMLAHGIATGSLFLLAQMIRRRFGTRDLGILGGIWSAVPRLGGSLTLFAMASLGLPGLAGFVGEFLVAAWCFLLFIRCTWFSAFFMGRCQLRWRACPICRGWSRRCWGR